MQKQPHKFLLYLDQNYVSSITKELLGRTHPVHAAYGKLMGKLFEVISRLVEEDGMLCPESTIHDQEFGFDPSLAAPAHRLLKNLSNGISFLSYGHIEMGQVLRAQRRYLGQPVEPECGRWEQAFYSDPHSPIERPRVYVHIPTPAEFAVEDKKRKDLIQAFRTRARTPGPLRVAASLAEYKRQEMLSVVQWRYVVACQEYSDSLRAVVDGTSPFPRLSPNWTWEDFADYCKTAYPPLAVSVLTEYLALAGGIDGRPDRPFWSFFSSPEFGAVQYYDVFTSLEAGFRFYRPSRAPRPSDPYDYAALASVLPYVDGVTTDREMKDMLVRLGLHRKYAVEVYSAGQKDVVALTERLGMLK